MRLGLILSNDWELFGDGSGDYFEIQHGPLEELLNVAEGHGAKITVMAEVGQQWAHRTLAATEAWAGRIADAWESILRETVRRGSDVQLHLHPTWLGAIRERDRWRLQMAKWSIASLETAEIADVLRRGRNYLEEVIKPVDPAYECIAFRAGAYCIEPSGKVIPAMKHAGIVCDTSVTKGDVDPQFYDYRDVVSDVLPWSTSLRSVKSRGRAGEGVVEMPIHSFPMLESKVLDVALGAVRSRNVHYRLNFNVPYEKEDLQWMAERRRVYDERYPAAERPFTPAGSRIRRNLSSPLRVARALLARPMVRLDYDFLPANVFVKSMSRILRRRDLASDGDDVIVPVVASGHVKNMHNASNADRILKAVGRTFGERVVHWTIRDAVNYWTPRLRRQDAVESARS